MSAARFIAPLVLLLLCSGCGEAEVGALPMRAEARGVPGAGDAPPAVLLGEREAATVTLTWLLRASDCLSCEANEIATEIRRLQREHRDRLEIRAVVVGGEPADVAAFLRRERIQASIAAAAPDELHSQLGDLIYPAIFATTPERILDRIEGTVRTGDGANSGWARLVARLEAGAGAG